MASYYPFESPLNSQSNETLILAAKRFNSWEKGAFSDIYDAFVNDIVRYVSYRVEDPSDREDVIGDAFFRALRSKRLPEDAQWLKHWLYRVAKTAVIDAYRTKKFHVSAAEVENDLRASRSVDSGKISDDRTSLEEVLSYLNSVDPEHREILILRIWDDLPFAEIAGITGKSENNCKKIVSRLLEGIRANVSYLLAITLVLSELWIRKTP